MGLSRGRRIAVWSLVVAGALVAVLAVFAVWSARQLLDEDNWQQTNAELIADPAIQSALAAYVVDQLYADVDVAGALEGALPSRLEALAAPAAGALREPLERSVRRLLAAPRVQQLWADATRVAHRQLMDLVQERGRVLRTPEGGGVVLDLRLVIGAAAQQLGLPLTGERLAPSAGRIVILTPDQLDALQRAVKLLKALAVVLLALSVVLLGLAVGLARGRRRETLAAVAMAVVVAAILVLLARHLVGDAVVGHLADTASAQAAADAAWTIGTSLLAQIARTLLLLAFVAAIAAWLAGPAGWAAWLRARMRPALSASPGLVHVSALALLLGLLTLGVIPAIRTPAAALALVVVTIGGVELVRRQAVGERT